MQNNKTIVPQSEDDLFNSNWGDTNTADLNFLYKGGNMNRIAKLGDVYCVQSQRFKKWCAYQVIEEKEDVVALLTLDWFSDNLPSESDLSSMKPLIIEGFGFNMKVETVYTSYKGVPSRFTYAGNIKSLFNQDIRSYGDWPTNYFSAEAEYLWKQYPKEDRKKYIDSNKSNEIVTISGRKLRERTSCVLLAESIFEPCNGRPFDNEIDNFANWSELDKLGALREIHYEGGNKEVLSYIEGRSFIRTLKWNKHGKKEIDISKTNLRSFIVDVQGLEKLVVNENLRTLNFCSNGDDLYKLHIQHPNQGQHLSIKINLDSEETPDFKLPHLSSLTLSVKNLDAQKIAEFYPNLKSLCIWGGPGNIHNIAALGQQKKLRRLQLKDLFGFTDEEFPLHKELENIENLWLTSIPAQAAKAIKKDYKDCMDIRISQMRSEKWLEANMGNPFRDWEGRENIPQKQAKDAFNTYKKTLSKLSKISSENENMEKSKVVLKEYVELFNEMQSIDTIEREEIADSFFMLLKKSGLGADGNTYMTWFDEWRDF